MSRRMPARRRRLPAILIVTGAAMLLGACSQGAIQVSSAHPVPAPAAVPPAVAARYGELPDEKFTVAAVAPEDLRREYVRQRVPFPTDQPPGTIVVDTHRRFLYLVESGGTALRYGVGVGKEGLAFKGNASIGRKAAWPHWTPTPDMIRREPDRYGKWRRGMDGGTGNPLGARALYLFKDGKDTLFRIHGTTEPETIGHAVSSGCIRMMNQDVIDFYNRVPKGASVVVR